jgi:hypothetical protein
MHMRAKGPTMVFIAVALFIGASQYAAHIYQKRQEYKTGVYIGKSAFTAANYQNGVCNGADSLQRRCEVRDLGRDSVMEDALASAHIIPSLADSRPLRTGFRAGWQEARSGAISGL